MVAADYLEQSIPANDCAMQSKPPKASEPWRAVVYPGAGSSRL